MKGLKNGKGKGYQDNKIIYEVEYLNYKRNGKGKGYEDNKIIYGGDI